ncbi:CoA transferase [Pigmentiphaga soli]|uniref:CoA transferase n=1 Tax=Pigmentiphaga soli TaxID=1007095 RepID=A0ABP8H9C7_9BURK
MSSERVQRETNAAARPAAGGHGPLAGIRVLDMTSVQMGPLATTILADLGADVLKIESPEGDISRNSQPSRTRGMGHSFLAINRNKRSVVLDLKQDDGRDALLELCRTADVLVFNVRPRAMARLRLGYDEVAAVNPRLVYVGAVGFGERGRYAGRPAYDTVLQGMIGIPWMQQQASGQEPRYVPFSYVDQSAGLHLVIGVLAALAARANTGRGQQVEVPMFENLVHVLLGEHLAGASFDPPAGPVGYRRQMARDRRPFQTRDGYICPFIYNDKQWRAFFALIGRPEQFEADARFSSHGNRVKNFEAVFAFLSEVFATRTTAEWTELFREHDLPVGPMNSLQDVLGDPHLQDVGYFRITEHPTEGRLRTACYPTTFADTPATSLRPAPRLGEHTVEALAEAGLPRERIEALLASGAAREAAPAAAAE